MDIVFDHSENVALNIRTFWFRPELKPDYLAGQFIELYLPHKNPDKRGQKRWFTLSSSPTEDLLAITTKYSGPKGSTFKQQLFNLESGTAVHITQPMGDFVLPKDTSLPLVLIAAGVGITPVRSIIAWLSAKRERRDIQIIYGVSNPSEVAFLDLFNGYGAKAEIVLSRTYPGWTGHTGSLDVNLINLLVPSLQGKLIYISGPELFVEKLESALKSAGIPGDQLVLDYYHGYNNLAAI